MMTPRRCIGLFHLIVCAAFADSTAARQSETAPWDVPRLVSDALPPPDLASPTQLLSAFGIDAGQLARFTDRAPLDEDQRGTLIRILFRMPQFSPARLAEWAVNGPALQELASAPADHRAAAVRVSGLVRDIQTRQVPERIQPGVGFAEYYRVELETETGHVVHVYTRAIPARWRQRLPSEAPAKANALFLKTGPGAPPALLLVARRIEWFPDRQDRTQGVTADEVWLARHGMDVGLFDEVRQRNRQPMDARDTECFYQLLAAVGRAEPQSLWDRARREFELAPLLQQPQQHHGRLFNLRGTARRVTRIVVSDREVRQRFGIDHYYQIDLFVPLGNQVVRLGRSASPEQSPTFVNTFPVTVCVRELPAALTVGESLSEQVRVPAVYFKLWAYRSRFVSSHDARQLQVSPMLIGRAPVLVQPGPPPGRFAGIVLAVVFLTTLAGIWLWVWRVSRADAGFTRRTSSTRFSLPEGKSLDDLELERPDEDR